MNNTCFAFVNIENKNHIDFDLCLTLDEKVNADAILQRLTTNFEYADIIKYLDLSNSNEMHTLICETTDYFIGKDFEENSYDEDELQRSFFADFDKKNQTLQIKDNIYTNGVLSVEVTIENLERSLRFLFKNYDDIDTFDTTKAESISFDSNELYFI